jgi:hypothetical protein
VFGARFLYEMYEAVKVTRCIRLVGMKGMSIGILVSDATDANVNTERVHFSAL